VPEIGLQDDLAGELTNDVLGVKFIEVEPAIVLSCQKVAAPNKSSFILLALLL
jgi:hypothetical protein